MYTPNLSISPQEHRSFKTLFEPEQVSLGLMLPIESYMTDTPTMENQRALIERAEELGFKALWVRDVPLRDPSFGDVGQVYEHYTYIGWLSAVTKNMILASGSAILPLRHPIHTAKQVASVDQLSNGRYLFGVASGDRPIEFPAFGEVLEQRGELFREALSTIKVLLNENFGEFQNHFGSLKGADLVPKPSSPLPVMITGGSGQEMEWIAQNADVWVTYPREIHFQLRVIEYWKELTQTYAPDVFKPFAQSLYVDLVENPNEHPTRIHLGYRTGRNALIQMIDTLRKAGVNHIVVNLKYGQRPAAEVIEELAEFVLPEFHQ